MVKKVKLKASAEDFVEPKSLINIMKLLLLFCIVCSQFVNPAAIRLKRHRLVSFILLNVNKMLIYIMSIYYVSD